MKMNLKMELSFWETINILHTRTHTYIYLVCSVFIFSEQHRTHTPFELPLETCEEQHRNKNQTENKQTENKANNSSRKYIKSRRINWWNWQNERKFRWAFLLET